MTEPSDANQIKQNESVGNHKTKIPSSVRNSLRDDISRLEDKCFGDLPVMSQRMLKAYAMMSHPEAYRYRKKTAEGYDDCFAEDSTQTKTAQKLINKIVKKMRQGNSAASRYLNNFMKDKKIQVHVSKDNCVDACCDGLDDKNVLHLTFDRGCFSFQNKHPDIINEDSFAVIVGHEIGHAVEVDNRGSGCSEKTTNHKTNGREVESFCDIFGLALAASAGYNLQPYIDKCAKYKIQEEKIRAKIGNVNDVHPQAEHRERLAKMIKKAYHNNIKKRTLFSDEIMSVPWNLPEDKEKINIKTINKGNSM